MDLTANSSPDRRAVATETVAVEPRPMVGPLLHSMDQSRKKSLEFDVKL